MHNYAMLRLMQGKKVASARINACAGLLACALNLACAKQGAC
jgi:hypothetical protein